jgi:uncharacterized membrane protein
MWNFVWPAVLIVASNTAYHIIAKSTPRLLNPFASLVVTYLIGAAAAFGMYCATSNGQSFKQCLSHMNWTSYALGFAIVGLEVGYLFLYRAGWNISVGPLVCNISLAVLLLVVGFFIYQDVLGLKQIAGAVLCLCGLVLINMK